MKATEAKSPANKVKSETKVNQTTSKAQKTTQKTTTRKTTADPLSMCPVDGAGWCPYPFSVAQLKKRLKAKAQQTQARQS